MRRFLHEIERARLKNVTKSQNQLEKPDIKQAIYLVINSWKQVAIINWWKNVDIIEKLKDIVANNKNELSDNNKICA